MELLRLLLSNKRVKILLGVVLLFGVVLVIVQYLTTGRLVIDTNSTDNKVTIYRLDDNGAATIAKEGTGTIGLRGKPGQYLVSVENRSFATRQNVQIEARKTSEYEVDVNKAGSFEPVLSSGAFAVIASKKQLLYLDADQGGLHRIGSAGFPVDLDAHHSYKRMKWADSSFGVGESDDGKLYVYSNGSFRALSVPSTNSLQTGFSYAVTKTHDVYISVGRNIYLWNARTSYKKVYSALSTSPSLVAGYNHLAILDRNNEHGKGEEINGEPVLTVLGQNGKSLTKKIEAYEVAWSPSDKFLAVSSDSAGRIYDAKLHEIIRYPDGNVNNLAWLGDDTLLYSINTSLWGFSLQTKKSSVIGASELPGAVSGIYPSQDDDYIYLAVAKISGGGYELKRIGLKGQRVPAFIYKLAVFLPVNLDVCDVNFVNFARPTAVLSPYSGNLASRCVRDAKKYLSDDQIDISKLNFHVGPVLPQSD